MGEAVAAKKKFAGKVHDGGEVAGAGAWRRRGEAVTEFGPELKTLVEEMFESMYAAQGIGLAAPQIAISKRIAVVDLSFNKEIKDKIALVNPEIVEMTGKQVEEEGCLSLPDIREKVQRAQRVKVRAQDGDG